MRKLVLATKNSHKAREIAAILDLPGIELLTMNDFPDMGEVIEDGATFEENAGKKAFEVARHCVSYSRPGSEVFALADDSGLMVDALGGMPGVLSARFAGEKATDADNNARLLQLLDGVPEEQRTARFVCVLVLCDASGKSAVVEGRCEGRILDKPRGSNGFGYDPLFLYPPTGLTFAEMPPDEKNRVSHRARALERLKEALMESEVLSSHKDNVRCLP